MENHEALAEFRARFQERSEIVDETSGQGVEDHLLRGVAQAQELFTPEPGFIPPWAVSGRCRAGAPAVLLIANKLAREP